MRCASTRVLPEPAPATMSSGEPACSTAARCCGLRSTGAVPARGRNAGAVDSGEAGASIAGMSPPAYEPAPTHRPGRADAGCSTDVERPRRLGGVTSTVGFRPTREDERILREAARPGETKSDVLRRALR